MAVRRSGIRLDVRISWSEANLSSLERAIIARRSWSCLSIEYWHWRDRRALTCVQVDLIGRLFSLVLHDHAEQSIELAVKVPHVLICRFNLVVDVLHTLVDQLDLSIQVFSCLLVVSHLGRSRWDWLVKVGCFRLLSSAGRGWLMLLSV